MVKFSDGALLSAHDGNHWNHWDNWDHWNNGNHCSRKHWEHRYRYDLILFPWKEIPYVLSSAAGNTLALPSTTGVQNTGENPIQSPPSVFSPIPGGMLAVEVAIPVVIVALLTVVAIAFFLWFRKKKRREQMEENQRVETALNK